MERSDGLLDGGILRQRHDELAVGGKERIGGALCAGKDESRSQLLRGFYNLAIRVQGHPPDLLKPILDDHEFSRTHHGRRMSF